MSMLILRPYKSDDAVRIVDWCRDERTFRQWVSDRYDYFPITEADMNDKYFDNNGDCIETDNFYPLTAVEEDGTIVGHMIIRYLNGDNQQLRFGWIIVDHNKRGQGYGKEMVQLAVKYSFEILQAEKISIGVFDTNMPAYYCYVAAGFKDVEISEHQAFRFDDERWNVLELELTREDYEAKKKRSVNGALLKR